VPSDKDWKDTFYASMTADREKIALGRTYDGMLDDITRPHTPVEVSITETQTGHVLHINIAGMCVVRICRIDKMIVNLDRKIWKEVQNGRG
jgi:hypothetical protein